MEQIEHIPIGLIVAEAQVRTVFDPGQLEGLVATLRSVGQLQPVRVRKSGDTFVLVDGGRRYAAAKMAGLPTLAAIVETEQLDEAGIVSRQLIANCQREDLNPLEKAKGIARLMEAGGLNAAQAAKRLGLSQPSVTRLLAILKLPEPLQEKIASGEIAASAACELARVLNPDEQQALAAQLTAGELTRDGLSGTRRAARRTVSTKARISRVSANLGDGRSVVVAGPGLDLGQCIGTLEELLTRARQARKNGMSLQTFVNMLRDQSGRAVAAD